MNRLSEWFLAEPDAQQKDDRQFIRERILTVVLMIGALLGVFAYIVNVRTAIQQNTPAWIVIYTLALAWVISRCGRGTAAPAGWS